MKYLLLSVGFLLIFTACGNKAKEDKTAEVVDTAYTQPVETTADQVKFPVYDFEGLQPLLNQEDGKTYIINFWATWCKPCLEEMPYFEEVNAERKSEGVEVILVSLDMRSMWKTRLEPYVEKKQLKSKVVILDDPDQNAWIPKIDANWDGAIPATVIYNQNNRKFYGHGFTLDELNEAVDVFVN
ncbi:TlpA disulfide reductase family protein [Flagellimonas myxillae]|uniref:TlpA disulfide reductase family protein n=1 Tax=Flagellimonas myxillae TaxID=2942214 RepID=UPI00201F7EE3|nr:TlpA disulfide reductase family protein [Muricauda myxillae]MCL6267990.1 TlpA family protein disulfide reductase [Muricauda myxillae]